jgi:molybdate transport system substrate-binding protein
MTAMRWLLCLFLLTSCAPRGTELTVSAAASLQSAMKELTRVYQHLHPGTTVTMNFGGSGMLAQQIEQGAPADVFLSASPKPMDTLATKGLIRPDTRRDLLHNEVVLIGTADSFAALAGQQVKLIALGDPNSVPAGDYGKQVLTSLGLWDAVQSKLVLAKDVRQVLSYVETGNADAGIVYATDARESGKVRIAATAPPGSHTPVVYPVAVLTESRHQAEARAFVAFLASEEMRAIFVRHGFTP